MVPGHNAVVSVVEHFFMVKERSDTTKKAERNWLHCTTLYDSKSPKFTPNDKVRLKPAATGFQHGSPVHQRRRSIEPVNKRGRHADSDFNSNSRRSLGLECSKGEL